MADKKYYAWNNFKMVFDESGKATINIKPGDPVDQKTLGATDEEWQYLVDTGAVRTQQHPDTTDAPANWFKEQAAAMSRGEFESADQLTPVSATDADKKAASSV